MNYLPLDLKWRSLDIDGTGMHRWAENLILRRMAKILGGWENTPYQLGQNSQGVGTYCTAFVCSVLDALYGRQTTPMPEIPADAAMHCPETARAGLRWFMRRYPCRRVEDGFVQPGDVLITGPSGGGPGHAILVGPRENTLWQCSGRVGVHFTGMSLPFPYVLHGVYRLDNRETWAIQ